MNFKPWTQTISILCWHETRLPRRTSCQHFSIVTSYFVYKFTRVSNTLHHDVVSRRVPWQGWWNLDAVEIVQPNMTSSYPSCMGGITFEKSGTANSLLIDMLLYLWLCFKLTFHQSRWHCWVCPVYDHCGVASVETWQEHQHMGLLHMWISPSRSHQMTTKEYNNTLKCCTLQGCIQDLEHGGAKDMDCHATL